MPDWIEGVPAIIELITALATFAGAAWGVWMGVYKPLRRHFNRVNAGMDTLLGYPPVLDPGSGREIQPATPPLAARVYDLEETNRKMAEALVTLADNQQRLTDLEADWEERRLTGERIIADFTEWRAQVNLMLTRWASEQDELAQIVRTNEKEDPA